MIKINQVVQCLERLNPIAIRDVKFFNAFGYHKQVFRCHRYNLPKAQIACVLW